MRDTVSNLVERIGDLEQQLEDEFARRRAALNYTIEHGRVIFERDVRKHHRALRHKLGSYLVHARPLVVLSAPVIYSVILPLVLLDVFVTLYQAICFPIYGIEKVRRRDYISLDRRHLAYLNGLEKLNCVYCGYGNGLLAYAREIAARTERHWCPIKHADKMQGTHRHYPEFCEYGDANAYQNRKAPPN